MESTPLSKTGKIAILMSGWYGCARQYTEGILRQAQLENAWDPILFVGEQAIDDFLCSSPRQFAGLISEMMDERLARFIRRHDFPNVLIDIRRTIGSRSAEINCDDSAIGRQSGEFCRDRGFRSLAYVGPDGRHLWSEIRRREFRKSASAEMGRLVSHAYANPKDLEQFLADLPSGTAVFCAHDLVALAVINCCKRIGRSVPGDLFVLGADNDRLICEYSMPQLTSIPIEQFHAGEIAATALTRLLRGESVTSPQTYGVGPIVERESTRRVTKENRHVSFCQKLISENAEGTLSIHELAQQVGCSRRKLEIDFKATTGHTLHEAIYEAKVARAKALISDTSLPLAEIAERCGFCSASHMTTAFNHILKAPPSDFR